MGLCGVPYSYSNEFEDIGWYYLRNITKINKKKVGK